MNLKLSAIVFVLLIIASFLPVTSDGVHVFVKSFYEGTSFGKTLAFIIWVGFFFALNFLKEKKQFFGILFNHSSLIIAGLVLVLWVFGIAMHLSILQEQSLPADAIVSSVIKTSRGIEWEASQLVHVHASKAALTPLLELLPISGFDTGMPMLKLLPSPELATVFLLLAFLLLGLMANEFLSLDSTFKEFFFIIMSFAIMVSIFDGGPFSVVGKIAMGMLTAYVLIKRGMQRNYVVFLLPFMVISTFAYFSAFFLESYIFIFSSYEILLLGIILSLTLAWKDIASKSFSLPVKSIVFVAMAILFAYFMIPKFLDFSYGEAIHAGMENKVMVYGLPEGTGPESIESITTEFGEIISAETHGYVGFFSIIPNKDMPLREIEQKLVEKLKPKSYLFAVKGVEEHTAEIYSSNEAEKLESVQSEFIYFEKTIVNGEEKLFGKSFFLHPYINLFAGSYLLQTGEENQKFVFSKIR
jgi:hypothetical protein